MKVKNNTNQVICIDGETVSPSEAKEIKESATVRHAIAIGLLEAMETKEAAKKEEQATDEVIDETSRITKFFKK